MHCCAEVTESSTNKQHHLSLWKEYDLFRVTTNLILSRETGVLDRELNLASSELNLVSIPYMGSPEGLRHH